MLDREYVDYRAHSMRGRERNRFMERIYLINSAYENESLVQYHDTFTIWAVYDALIIEHDYALELQETGRVISTPITVVIRFLEKMLNMYRIAMVDRMHGTIDPMMSPH